MIDSAGSNWIRVAGYLVVAALAQVARWRERRRAALDDGVWPPFWMLTGAVLVVMAIARAGSIGDAIGDLGRERAENSGWYQSRRPVQAVVVAAVGMGWLISVSVACWRTPERRRRYLPMGLAIVTLLAFAAIRIVSLHQIDSVLHRRHIGVIRVGTLTELLLLVVASLATLWVPVGRAKPDTPTSHGQLAVES